MPLAPPHLIVPFAAASSDAGRQALHDLALPNLERLLARLVPGEVDAADEFTFSPPHERALAHALGWPVEDGRLPWGARAAAALDIDPADHAWALLTPVHLHIGTEQISLTDPAALRLDTETSRALFDAVRPLFESEGFVLHWAGPLEWLAAHPQFDGLATASLDRVIGRGLDPWLPERRQARLLRRLEIEVQMQLHAHPANERREGEGQQPVNSFWASGCGRARPEAAPAPEVDERLRAPALAEDWVAWREAWQQLDAGPIAALAAGREPVTLTLCGERAAARYETRPQPLWQRVTAGFRRPALHSMLERL